MKQAFWKIPKEWVKDWGLSGYEAIVLADIKAWDKPCTLDERAERCGISKNGVRKALENIAKKVPQSSTTEVPQSVQKKYTKCTDFVHKVAQKSTQSGTKKVHKVAFPPHPPIIEERDIEENEEIRLQKADASATKKREKKYTPEEQKFHGELRDIFLSEWKALYGDDFEWGAADMVAAIRLKNSLKFKMKSDGYNSDDINLLRDTYRLFIHKTLKGEAGDFFISKDLKTIASQFNSIYITLRNGKSSTKRQQGVTDEFIRRTAEQVAANGGLAF